MSSEAGASGAVDARDGSALKGSVVAGWREWVSLPDLGVEWIKAKLDTGARTSALHAFDPEEVTRADGTWIRFTIQPWQRSTEDAVRIACPVIARRTVRSSSGHSNDRWVVAMDLTMVGRRVSAEVTLTARDEMGFRMLIGRQALRQGFVVHPGRSYLGGRPGIAVRRRNLGR